MNKELRDRIKQWNEIKYGIDTDDRIVIYTLKPRARNNSLLLITSTLHFAPSNLPSVMFCPTEEITSSLELLPVILI